MLPLRSAALALLLALPFLAPKSSAAQVSLYGTVDYTRYAFSTSTSNLSYKGGSGGLVTRMFYNFPIQSRLTAGVDLRASYSPGYNGGTFETAALRIGFVPHHVPLRPYFQLGGGVISTRRSDYTVTYFPTGGYIVTPLSGRVTSGAAELVFGLDIRLTDSFDWRAIDYGAVGGVSDSTSGAGFIGTGIVYHLGSTQSKRKP